MLLLVFIEIGPLGTVGVNGRRFHLLWIWAGWRGKGICCARGSVWESGQTCNVTIGVSVRHGAHLLLGEKPANRAGELGESEKGLKADVRLPVVGEGMRGLLSAISGNCGVFQQGGPRRGLWRQVG
jgi:hypothetical protein